MKNKFYIRGDKERGAEVIAELKKRGGTPDRTSHGNWEDTLYFIDNEGMIVYTRSNTTFGTLIQETCKEIKLPSKQEYHFEPFDKVVVRYSCDDRWGASFFSHYEDGREYPYVTSVGGFNYCLPYNEETKKLIGTTDDWEG